MFDGCDSTPSADPCSSDDLAIWTRLSRAHAVVEHRLDHDLRAAHGLPLSDFTILRWLAHGSCARMSSLAESAQLSPSGLSRAIERLQKRGLVIRQQCVDDRRGVHPVLTSAGAELVQLASRTYVAAIRRRFLEHLSPEERISAAAICDRILAANGSARDQTGCSPESPSLPDREAAPPGARR